MERPKILIIEDNLDTINFLKTLLSKKYDVLVADNAVLGIELAKDSQPNLIILDVMLPMLNGFDACSLLRKDERTRAIPIIILSAKSTSTDIANGLNIGANDYISKPFDYKELLARIAVRLREADSNKATGGNKINIAGITIDQISREVFVKNEKIDLTSTEFELLKLLITNPGQILSRAVIMNSVWKHNKDTVNDRTIDVHIRAIRKKIPSLTKNLVSVYGEGYKFEK